MERCASDNTVVASVASGSYIPSIKALAESASAVGFPCTVTQPYDSAHAALLRSEKLFLLPLPPAPLLPRRQFCEKEQPLYGWRRAQLHKMHMLRAVLAASLNVLSIDANFRLGANPAAALRDLPLQSAGRRKGEPRRVDVAAMHDGPNSLQLNIGLLWVRSTESTRAMAERVVNRTWGSWDQYVFNEELSTTAEIGCCHSQCMKSIVDESGDMVQKSSRGARSRREVEGADVCADDVPFAAPPSADSRYWRTKVRWNGSVYNVPARRGHRRFMRCTEFGPNVTCHGFGAKDNCSGLGHWRGRVGGAG